MNIRPLEIPMFTLQLAPTTETPPTPAPADAPAAGASIFADAAETQAQTAAAAPPAPSGPMSIKRTLADTAATETAATPVVAVVDDGKPRVIDLAAAREKYNADQAAHQAIRVQAAAAERVLRKKERAAADGEDQAPTSRLDASQMSEIERDSRAQIEHLEKELDQKLGALRSELEGLRATAMEQSADQNGEQAARSEALTRLISLETKLLDIEGLATTLRTQMEQNSTSAELRIKALETRMATLPTEERADEIADARFRRNIGQLSLTLGLDGEVSASGADQMHAAA